MTQNDLLQLLADIKQFDIQNLSLDLLSMSWQSKDAIVSSLQTESNASFACERALPEFKFNESGFLIVDEQDAVFGSGSSDP